MCELVVLVQVVVKTLANGWTDAVVVNGIFEVPGLAVSDVIGDLIELVVLHVSVVGWLRALLRLLFTSTSARSPSELDRPRGLRHSDGGLDSCIFRRRRISARSSRWKASNCAWSTTSAILR